MPREQAVTGSFVRPLVALSLTRPDVGLLKYASLATSLSEMSEIRFAHVLATEAGAAEDIKANRTRMENEVRACFDALPEHVEFDVVSGPRLDELLELSLRHRHDLIVLGHRRARSGRRSLARRLAMVAPCSVWLAPEGAPPQITGILAPIDFSSHSADALSVATSIAAARGIKRVYALHVFFDPSTIRYDEHLNEIRGQEEAAFARMLEDVDCHAVEVEPIFDESTHVADAVLRVAKRLVSDLIVMNTRGRSLAAAVFLGSVTSATMAATGVPLLAVKHFGSRLPLLSALLSQRIWSEPSPKTN
jgi:nucleotide-binding universal stress UspA family protein